MRLLVCFLLFSFGVSAETPVISRPARPWQFFDAIGQKAAILGREDGTVEGWVYPLKLYRDLKLRFVVDGHVIPAEAIARQDDVRGLGRFASPTRAMSFVFRKPLSRP